MDTATRFGLFLLWAAKLLALAIVALVLFIVIAHALPGGEGLPEEMTVPHAGFILMIGGLGVGLFLPLYGGLVALAGSLLFYGYEYAAWGRLPGGPIFPLVPIASVLLIAAGLLRLRKRSRTGAAAAEPQI